MSTLEDHLSKFLPADLEEIQYHQLPSYVELAENLQYLEELKEAEIKDLTEYFENKLTDKNHIIH